MSAFLPLTSDNQQAPPLLELDTLSVKAPGGKVLLAGVSFSLAAAECLAVIGPNGSGKSTLLRALTGELSPATGRVLYQGQPVGKLGRMGRARAIALLAQHDNADPGLSVEDYVALGRIPYHTTDKAWQRQQHIEQALTDTGLQALRTRRLAGLSGGERQRAALARAFAQTPQLLLLDEPTNHLDPLARSSLLARVKRKGIAVIAVLHDLALVAPFARRVVVIQQGKLVCCASADKALSAETIGHVFGMESFVITHPRSGKPFYIFDAPVGV